MVVGMKSGPAAVFAGYVEELKGMYHVFRPTHCFFHFTVCVAILV